MAIATWTGKGQITLPVSVRTSLKGRFAGRVAKPVSPEAMETAIGESALERQRRSGR